MGTMTFGLTLPQRGVFFGVTTVSDMLTQAQDADRSGLATACSPNPARNH
jgi:hypothetical protein